MRKTIFTLLGALMALPSFARDFDFTYQGQTLTYTILDEEAKTVMTKEGSTSGPGNNITGDLIIPSVVRDGNTEYTVIEIGYRSFYDCSTITSVSIPESVTSIGTAAFYYCTGLTKSEFASIEHLCKINFVNGAGNPICSSHNLYINGQEVRDVVIPETVDAIKNNTFYECEGLTSVTIPNTVVTIGDNAFLKCTGLTSVTIPNSVISIGDQAFSNCSNLTSIDLSNSLTSIGKAAFNFCSNLTSVSIPESVISIGDMAFTDCYRMTKAEFASIEHLCKINFGDGSNPLALAHNLYINGEEVKDVVIPSSIESINPYAFTGCNMTSVTIQKSVTNIGSNAFHGCTELKSLIIPESVTSIGPWSFAQCYELKSLEIPESVISIGEYAFYSCVSLSSVIISNSVESLGMGSFYYCTNLSSIKLGNNLKTINNFTFCNCTELTEVVIPPSVETLGYAAFQNNSKLNKIVIGSEIKNIDAYAFDGCPAAEVYISATVPPTAFNNSFSNYDGNLYLQGEYAVDEYMNSVPCWNQFKSANTFIMVEPTEIVTNTAEISGKPGESFQLSASLEPASVSLPFIFWCSTDPEIATVDIDGLVTLHADTNKVITRADDGEDNIRTCKIIARSLYADGPVAEVTITNNTMGVEDVRIDSQAADEIDWSAPLNIYNLNGLKVNVSQENLPSGLYIVRQGKNIKKIMVK